MKHHTLRRDRVVALREERGWSQTQLAKLLGVSVPAMSQFESGAGEPSADTTVRMARLLSVEFAEITTAKEPAEIAEAS